jgi:hypothetical protein
MRLVVALAIIAGVLTGFDGAATWYEVEFLKVAEEANPLLQGVESIVGFTGAMVFRIVGGLLLLLGVVYAAHRSMARGRNMMVLGLFIVCIFYALLDYYHWMILWNFRHLVP